MSPSAVLLTDLTFISTEATTDKIPWRPGLLTELTGAVLPQKEGWGGSLIPLQTAAGDNLLIADGLGVGRLCSL